MISRDAHSVDKRDGSAKARHGKLPHIDPGSIHQFLTFRLADSLPAEALNKLELEQRQAVPEALNSTRHEAIERLLDQGAGSCLLRLPEAARELLAVLRARHEVEYDLTAWVIMPNHVHAMIRPVPGKTIRKIVQAWKSVSARRINAVLNREGELWQGDYWDRYIRDDDHFRQTLQYIHLNPVMAGLVRKPEEWPWSSAARGPSSGSTVST
jgi:putative transposase